MKNFEDNGAKRSLDRRSFLGITGAFAAGTITSGLSHAAPDPIALAWLMGAKTVDRAYSGHNANGAHD
jgi:hypothetical protein